MFFLLRKPTQLDHGINFAAIPHTVKACGDSGAGSLTLTQTVKILGAF